MAKASRNGEASGRKERRSKASGSKASGSKASGRKASKELIDVRDMKGNVVARVEKIVGKKGAIGERVSLQRAAEMRLVNADVDALDVREHAWCDGMKVAYYKECLAYWNEVAVQLEGWGLDVRRIDVDVWCGAWVAWGRGVTQAKLVKRLFAAGYGIGGQSQADARKVKDARTREERLADVDAILKGNA